MLNLFEKVDYISTWTDDDGKTHFRLRVHNGGKEYPDSRERGFEEAIPHITSYKFQEPYDWDVIGSGIDIETGQPNMTCVEYIEDEYPEHIHLDCRKGDNALESFDIEYYFKENLEKRVSSKDRKEIREMAIKEINRIPDVLYHKVPKTNVAQLLKDKKFRSSPVYTSTEFIPVCQMYIGNREVTLKLKRPKGSCPFPAIYGNPLGLEKYDPFKNALLLIYLNEELKKKYGDVCSTFGPEDSGIMIYPSSQMASEKEIQLHNPDAVTFKDTDILEIMTEGDCGLPIDELKHLLRENGLDDFISLIK